MEAYNKIYIGIQTKAEPLQKPLNQYEARCVTT